MTDPPKSDWGKGDLIAMPADLQRGHTRGGISNGCSVFIAEADPHLEHGVWRYFCRDCRELRRATAADLDRLIAVAERDVARETERLERLRELLISFWKAGYFAQGDTP